MAPPPCTPNAQPGDEAILAASRTISDNYFSTATQNWLTFSPFHTFFELSYDGRDGRMPMPFWQKHLGGEFICARKIQAVIVRADSQAGFPRGGNQALRTSKELCKNMAMTRNIRSLLANPASSKKCRIRRAKHLRRRTLAVHVCRKRD